MSLSSNDFELLLKKLIKIKRLISSFFLAFLVYPKIIMFTQKKKIPYYWFKSQRFF